MSKISSLLPIKAETEAKKISSFIRNTLRDTSKERVVLGWSGGIDSTVSLFLLARAIPVEHITILHLPYKTSYLHEFQSIQKLLRIPDSNINEHPILVPADELKKNLHIPDDRGGRVRFGNIMARLRMTVLFDKAREIDALVCGTENKSEQLLGYFTRYGDGASDMEPIVHLYKTQVYELARFLKVPPIFLEKDPSAGLWSGQTDEDEFGFTYEEADIVLHLYYDKGEALESITEKGYANTKKIISFMEKNSFKHHVPYFIR